MRLVQCFMYAQRNNVNLNTWWVWVNISAEMEIKKSPHTCTERVPCKGPENITLFPHDIALKMACLTVFKFSKSDKN